MNIFEKLCHIQNELKAPKSEFNPFGNFKYRNAESILQAVKPICLKYETTILLTDSIEVIEGRFFMKTIAELIDWSVDGETEGKVISTPGWAEFPSLKAKTDEAQRTGIASSYAKKRALESLLGLSGEKDSDGYDNTKVDNAEKEKVTENWRLIDGNVVLVKGQDGKFYDLTRLNKKQLEVALKNPLYEGIKPFIEVELQKK